MKINQYKIKSVYIYSNTLTRDVDTSAERERDESALELLERADGRDERVVVEPLAVQPQALERRIDRRQLAGPLDLHVNTQVAQSRCALEQHAHARSPARRPRRMFVAVIIVVVARLHFEECERVEETRPATHTLPHGLVEELLVDLHSQVHYALQSANNVPDCVGLQREVESQVRERTVPFRHSQYPLVSDLVFMLKKRIQVSIKKLLIQLK